MAHPHPQLAAPRHGSDRRWWLAGCALFFILLANSGELGALGTIIALCFITHSLRHDTNFSRRALPTLAVVYVAFLVIHADLLFVQYGARLFALALLQTLRLLVMIWGVCLAALMLGRQRTISALLWAAAALLLINLLWVVATDVSEGSIGGVFHLLESSQRGIYFHKNIAGDVAALCVLLGVVMMGEQVMGGRRLCAFLIIGGAFFLYTTASKTAQVALACALFFLLFACAIAAFGGSGTRPRKIIFSIFLVLLAVVISFGIGIVPYHYMETIFPSNYHLTGRTVIWGAMFSYLAGSDLVEHAGVIHALASEQALPALYWGFGPSALDFYSPLSEQLKLQNIDPASLYRWIGHSHSGYVGTIWELGLVGLALAVLTFLVAPAWQASQNIMNCRLSRLVLAVLVFLMLANVTEPSISMSAKRIFDMRPAQGAFLLVLALLRLVGDTSPAKVLVSSARGASARSE